MTLEKIHFELYGLTLTNLLVTPNKNEDINGDPVAKQNGGGIKQSIGNNDNDEMGLDEYALSSLISGNFISIRECFTS